MAHKVGRKFKKEILDDVMGIDENKTFGISNKTFVGKNLAKVTPGGKNSIFEQVGKFGQDKIIDPVKDVAGGLVDNLTGKTAKKQREAQLQALRDQQSALEAKENEANRMALASTLLSRGKGKFFDITRPESVEQFLMDKEGEYLDPFPDYLRQSGDYLLKGLEDTAGNIENYTGTSDDMMRNFQPTFDKLNSANDSAVDRLQSIYDGRMENELRGFQDRTNDITRQLQGLNTESAEMERGLQRGVLDQAERYADSLGRSVDMETALANRRFDELDAIPDYMRNTADELLNAERAKARIAGANIEATGNAGRRGLQSAMVGQGSGTGQSMANAMIQAQLGQDRSDLLADALINNIERRGDADLTGAQLAGERFETLGEINPALADVYRDEAMLNRANTELGFGDTRLTARAQNLGLDQGMVDSDQSLYNMIMNQQLSNTGMIPGMGMQSAMLPALFGEAGLASQGPLARSVSPYTSTGTLPQGQTVFQDTPYTPAPEGPKKNWIDYLAQAPEYINKGRQVLGGIRDIFS